MNNTWLEIVDAKNVPAKSCEMTNEEWDKTMEQARWNTYRMDARKLLDDLKTQIKSTKRGVGGGERQRRFGVPLIDRIKSRLVTWVN